MFYDIYVKLCEERGVAPTRVLRDLGIAKSTIANWKNGAEPTNRTIKAISDYFGLTVEELKSGKTKKLAFPEWDDELAQENYEIFKGLSDEKKEEALRYLRYLRDSLKIKDND